jgi:hypothetical protein
VSSEMPSIVWRRPRIHNLSTACTDEFFEQGSGMYN